MKYYVVIHDPDGDRYIEYEGMAEATVRTLAEEFGHPIEFVTKDVYDEAHSDQ